MNILKLLVLSIAVIGLLFSCKMATETGQIQASSNSSNEDNIKIMLKTDTESIGKGKGLFDSKCSFCHDPNSTNTIVGPGLKGILKKAKLPISKRAATPKNIENQLKKPYRNMPSFSYMSEEDILNIIAYLNTL